MRRIAMTCATGIAALVIAACGGTGGGDDSASSGAGTVAARPAKLSPADITLWVGFTQRELGVMRSVVKQFERQHPGVHVKVVGGINDDKIVAASRGGQAPDVAQSFSADNSGAFCNSGAWIDLKPYMQRDGIKDTIFPPAPRAYTQYRGTRCALPMLADAYGLYYNEKLLREAGLNGPPKTTDELVSYAKKLTKRNPDGSLRVVGLDPSFGWYENTPASMGPMFGGQWVDEQGHSMLGQDPAWAKLLRWQKSLIDWYGYDKLVRFQSGVGDEFSASNAFETGKVAMHLDGEWRTAFIADEAPHLGYGTAPLPTDPAHPELYGSGYVSGSIAGIPKRAEHKEHAWALLKFLTTDDRALAALSNGLRNVPTTASATKSPLLKPDEKFATFIKIFNHPKTSTTPVTPAGSAPQELFNSFVNKWQAGRVSDLEAGLKDVDKQIDAQLANATGSQVP
jgi:multiple sugar transport system substrate-binding protein